MIPGEEQVSCITMERATSLIALRGVILDLGTRFTICRRDYDNTPNVCIDIWHCRKYDELLE
jgi:hypothetical protein